MPKGDGTGPLGLGPMTGRRVGYCAGYCMSGFANPAVLSFGCGAARWRGNRIGFEPSFRTRPTGGYSFYTGFATPVTEVFPKQPRLKKGPS
ncbi:MAG: DUF5320 domain-containing protein [Armatimonadota bacterium]|nr:DUF5320 domain-containing protein [Armatimonadota bacterium]